jgi:23S rRNA (cytosine1962-C5)-methyltransferase
MLKLRNLLLERAQIGVDSIRLFHGRGKMWEEFSHLSIDYFAPYTLITTYKEISDEEKTSLKDLVLSLELNLKSVLLQKRYLREEAVEILWGEKPTEAFAVEKGEKYLINLESPQNIGFFLDMRVGRDFMRESAQGKRVLNLFAYTCSLSIAALKGGAVEVVNIDMSKAALRRGEENHVLNGLKNSRVKFIPYDIMKSFGNITRKGPYDIIIIDPPTNQGLSFSVERDYHKIVKRLAAMTEPGAIIYACLNSPLMTSDFLLNVFQEHGTDFEFKEKYYSSFRPMEKNPEEGLKILTFVKK